MEKLEWKVERIKVSDLINWKKNPRTITKAKHDELQESLDELGDFNVLALDYEKKNVLSGNQRLRIKAEMGEEYVDVKVPNRPLTEKEKERVSLIGNIESGRFDVDKLANEFEEEILKSTGLINRLKDVDFDKLKPDQTLSTKTMICPHCKKKISLIV